MAIIDAAVERVKRHLGEHLGDEQIEQACVMAGHRWRNRKLNPVVTVKLFALQVLHKNIACRTVRHLAGMDFTPTAYCNARRRLPIDVLKLLCQWVTASVKRQADAPEDRRLWRGHRAWAVDGTGVSMPDTPDLQQAFGMPAGMKPGCGFPVAHLLFLMENTTGLIGGHTVDPCHTHDLAKVSQVHSALASNDVLVGDRGFCSYAHFALLLQDNLHGVFRRHQRLVDPGHMKPTTNMMRRVKRLGLDDHLVELRKPQQQPTWISANDWEQLPDSILLRQVSYRVVRKGCRTRKVSLLTTLLDVDRYPRSSLTELYDARWRIETNLRHLKTTMGMNVLHCQSVDGVCKELWMYVLVYNLVQCTILKASRRQRVASDQISFIDALDALRYNASSLTAVLLVNAGRHHRTHLIEPRVLKRRKDGYTYMTKPRSELRKPLTRQNKRVTA